MTDLSTFTDDERDLLLETTGVVMKGAIVADGSSNPIHFLQEVTAGAKAFKAAQRHENPFVRSVALALRERGADPEADDRDLPFAEEAITAALKHTREAMTLLRAKADPEDAAAYGEWLLRIATGIAEAARTKEDGFFSGKVAVTEGERLYLDELAQAIG